MSKIISKRRKNKIIIVSLAAFAIAVCSTLLIVVMQGDADAGKAGIMHEHNAINVDADYALDLETQTVNTNFDSITNEEVVDEIIVDGVNYFDASTYTDFGISMDWLLADSLSAMYNRADHIVIGSFGEFESSFNTARRWQNPLEEDPYNYYRGLVYTFNVQAVLKGTIEDDSIRIVLPYLRRHAGEIRNDIFNAQGEVVRSATEIDPWVVYMRDEFFIEPNPNEVVMMFLGYGRGFDTFRLAIEPCRIALENDGTIRLISNLLLSVDKRAEVAVSHGMSDSGRPITITNRSLSRVEMPDAITGITGMSISDLVYTIRDYDPSAPFDADAIIALFDPTQQLLNVPHPPELPPLVEEHEDVESDTSEAIEPPASDFSDTGGTDEESDIVNEVGSTYSETETSE